jgi:acyl-CoA synthetase (AMP-forming)/AMP-acid ligase II
MCIAIQIAGDRVGICSRNCPDFLISFWACRTCQILIFGIAVLKAPKDLIGAVSVLTNAYVSGLLFVLNLLICFL